MGHSAAKWRTEVPGGSSIGQWARYVTSGGLSRLVEGAGLTLETVRRADSWPGWLNEAGHVGARRVLTVVLLIPRATAVGILMR
jgi:hypothetical protein